MTLWPLGLYTVLVLLLVTAMIVVSHLLGPRHRDRATGSPFEGGILPAGTAGVRLSARFYLFAMFFVIFDLEGAFIFTWAVAGRELGWPGFTAILVFIILLVAALVYLWRAGALEWRTSRVRRPESGSGMPRNAGRPSPARGATVAAAPGAALPAAATVQRTAPSPGRSDG